MAQFQLYNYQFGKIESQENPVDLFGNPKVLMSAKESFPIRQDVFQKIMDEDYSGGEDNKIRVAVQGDEKGWQLKREYISRQYTTNLDDVIVLKVK